VTLSRLRRYTLEYFAKALTEHRGNRTRTAEYLGVSVKTVRAMIYEMAEYGLTEDPDTVANRAPWNVRRQKILAALKANNYSRKATAKALGVHVENVYDAIFRLRGEGEIIPARWAVSRERKPIPHLCLRCKGKSLLPVQMKYKNIQGPVCQPCIPFVEKENETFSKSKDGLVTKDAASAIQRRIDIERKFLAIETSKISHPTMGGATRFGKK